MNTDFQILAGQGYFYSEGPGISPENFFNQHQPETNNIMKTKTLLALFAFVLAGGLSAAGLFHAASDAPIHLASDDPCGPTDPDPGPGPGNGDDMPSRIPA